MRERRQRGEGYAVELVRVTNGRSQRSATDRRDAI